MHCHFHTKFLEQFYNQTISDTAEAMLWYSATAELRLIVCYFLDFQEIKDPPSYTTKPVTERLVLGKDAQSKSQNTDISEIDPFLSNTPRPGEVFIYLTTLKGASQCDYFSSYMNRDKAWTASKCPVEW